MNEPLKCWFPVPYSRAPTHSQGVIAEEAGEAAAAVLHGEGLPVGGIGGGLAGVEAGMAGCSGRRTQGGQAGKWRTVHLCLSACAPLPTLFSKSETGVAAGAPHVGRPMGAGQSWPQSPL